MRPVQPDDAEALTPIRNQPSVMKGLHRQNYVTVESLRKTIETACNDAAMGLHYGCVITRRQDGRIIGLVELDNINLFAGSAQLTAWLDEAERRKHYGSEASKAMIDWGFRDLGVERIEVWVLADNAASLAAMKSYPGFVPRKDRVFIRNSAGEEKEVVVLDFAKTNWPPSPEVDSVMSP